MKKIFLLPLILLFCFQLSSQSIDFDTVQLRNNLYFLASDSLKGRLPGSSEGIIAARFIADKFQENGAKLLCNYGLQEFKIVSEVKIGEHNYLKSGNNEFELKKDFLPLSFSKSSSAKGALVFAGFGIDGESNGLKWDDYSGVDVKGKWVMILRGDPEPDSLNSGFVPLSGERFKSLKAYDKGAIGVIFVSPSSIEKSDDLIRFTNDRTITEASIPVINVTRSVAAQLLMLNIKAIDSIENKMINERKSINFETFTEVDAESEIVRTLSNSYNVIGEIKGKNDAAKAKYIIIGAHFDHLGFGGSASGSRLPDTTAIHYGADDNASGVVTLIELLKYFNANKPNNSLIFVSFDAEEMGLLGSRSFIENLPIAKNSIKAMINFDMVGRLDANSKILFVSGIGTFNEAEALIKSCDNTSNFNVKYNPDGYGPSDHAVFYSEQIPVLYLTTGAHTDYHTPFDTPDKINYIGISEICAIAAELINKMANSETDFTFKESKVQAQNINNRRLKVTLGILPDVSGGETNGGMKVEGVKSGGPAGKGGMVKGDIITKINGLSVKNIYDYMARLSNFKIGEIINIEVIRNNEIKILIIQL